MKGNSFSHQLHAGFFCFCFFCSSLCVRDLYHDRSVVFPIKLGELTLCLANVSLKLTFIVHADKAKEAKGSNLGFELLGRGALTAPQVPSAAYLNIHL